MLSENLVVNNNLPLQLKYNNNHKVKYMDFKIDDDDAISESF